VFPKVVRVQYFRVKRESICPDISIARVSASCYGVNLAFSLFLVFLEVGRRSRQRGWGPEIVPFPEMVQEEYFRVKRKSICLDISIARVSASCYGVNLAFSGFWVLGFWFFGRLWWAGWDGGMSRVAGGGWGCALYSR